MQLPRSWQIMTRAAYFYVRGAVSNSLNLRVGNLKRSTERGDCKKICPVWDCIAMCSTYSPCCRAALTALQ